MALLHPMQISSTVDWEQQPPYLLERGEAARLLTQADSSLEEQGPVQELQKEDECLEKLADAAAGEPVAETAESWLDWLVGCLQLPAFGGAEEPGNQTDGSAAELSNQTQGDPWHLRGKTLHEALTLVPFFLNVKHPSLQTANLRFFLPRPLSHL